MDTQVMKRNRGHIIAYIILSLVIVALLWWAIAQNMRAKRVEASVQNQYNRAFFELADYVDDIDTSLYKSMLVNSPAQMATISTDIFRKSEAAKSCLGQLPLSNVELDNTSKFLSQVGDYSYFLAQNMIKNHPVTDEEYKNLESLKNYSASLNDALLKMQNELYSGDISFNSGSANRRFSQTVEAAGGDVSTGMEGVEKDFESYPSLIYDGPFSEHIETAKPVMLENAPEISQDEAMAKAKEFLGSRGDALSFESDTQNTNIDAYTFASNQDNRQISISVTKKGGYVIYFLDNRSSDAENISTEAAVASAADFLQSKGFVSMKNSYFDKSNNIATINFAYSENNITCYSDLVKVRVALDTGEVIGMECHGYIMNHKQRSPSAPRLSAADARAKVNPRLMIESETMAIIPKDSMKEVYCYEFQGKYQERKFIIYINADTGEEEKILILLETEDGILSM